VRSDLVYTAGNVVIVKHTDSFGYTHDIFWRYLNVTQEITVHTKGKTLVEKKTVGRVKISDLSPQEDTCRRCEQKIPVPKDALTTAVSKDHEAVKIQSFLKVRLLGGVELHEFLFEMIVSD